MAKLTWILHGILGIFLTAGVIGMCVYGAYSDSHGPFLVVNNYLGLWITSVLTFCVLQSFYILIAPHPHYTETHFAAIQYIYHFLLGALCTIICVGYAIYGRIEISIWSALSAIVCWFSMYLIHYIRQDKLLDYTKKSVVTWTFSVINGLAKFCFFVVCCFLAAGAMYHGAGVTRYPMRGTLHKVTTVDGKSQNVHVYCEGPTNSSVPVILFEGSTLHGYADYLGLQRVVTEKGYRSCSWDKIGLGYSDYFNADQHWPESYYDSLIESVKQTERAPFIFVGWGGGGAFIYDYATRHPENVRALIYIDAYPVRSDFTMFQVLGNLTDSETAAFMHTSIDQAIDEIRPNNVIGVPWGLMSLMTPADTSNPEDLRGEKRWYYLTEKMRIAQRWTFADIPNQIDPFVKNITGNITVSAIMSVWNDSQVEGLECERFKLDAAGCEEQKKSNEYKINARKGLVKNGGVVEECREDACDLGYFVDVNPQYTVEKILHIWETIKSRT